MCFKPALSRCSTNSCIGGCTLRYGFLLCPVNNPPPGPVDRPPPGPVDRPPPGPVNSPPPGPVDIPPPGPVDRPPPGPVDRPPPGHVDSPPPGPVEAPPPGPVESPPHRRVDNPPPGPVDRSRGQPLAFMPVMLGDGTGHYRRCRPRNRAGGNRVGQAGHGAPPVNGFANRRVDRGKQAGTSKPGPTLGEARCRRHGPGWTGGRHL
jgi:hypothetical protein